MLEAEGRKPKKKQKATKLTSGLFGSEEISDHSVDLVIRFDNGFIFQNDKHIANYRWHEDKIRTRIEFLNPVAWCDVTGKDEAERFVLRRLQVLAKKL